jgi:hypothetical protein
MFPGELIREMLREHVSAHVNCLSMTNNDLTTGNNLMQERHIDAVSPGHVRHVGVSARLDDANGCHIVLHRRNGRLALGKFLPQLERW